MDAGAADVRVDLTEVKAALTQHPAVAAAAAKLWRLPAGPVLAAYVELDGSSSTASPSRPAGMSGHGGIEQAPASGAAAGVASVAASLQRMCR